ncbi:TPA: UDP-3-O-acyl-N-acetylglucosamine deacetylase [Klebsiella quasipneumoniae subsp. quasipneumoniae]|nr:UDP-3-O-acyl-N-acetylglucosamine deacetylase [Klebsiella quasipneumoniae subsp. similipneumoniae]HBR1460324.1 UDP-3-O-acyl-N-acetylglucosamine deacetylase [Klebsiella quasipneumoniae subsp. quasipneumoniae]HBR2034433.1 UDP-3-O-acyl-N-acetylglucosamine deacetylase [Klebsiella quasipneumoniae subsp. quasipneumoniae]
MIKQKTIRTSVSMTGIGLHSGLKVQMNVIPAGINTGIVFRRVDLHPAVDIPLRAENIKETTLATTIFNDDGVRVSTIEHLLSAISGLGIDNLLIELNAGEIPIVDGSSAPFVYLLLNDAGVIEQSASKKFLKINEEIRVELDDKWATLAPFNGFHLDFTIDFNHPAISSDNKRYTITLSPEVYIAEISRARTFGFLRDVEYLQSKGLGLGASLDNAIGLDEFRVLNKDGLRYEDEFVRHKTLDAIGDLFVCGYNILGAFTAYKSGHALNNLLIRSVLQNQQAWEFVQLDTAPFSEVLAGSMIELAYAR